MKLSAAGGVGLSSGSPPWVKQPSVRWGWRLDEGQWAGDCVLVPGWKQGSYSLPSDWGCITTSARWGLWSLRLIRLLAPATWSGNQHRAILAFFSTYRDRGTCAHLKTNTNSVADLLSCTSLSPWHLTLQHSVHSLILTAYIVDMFYGNIKKCVCFDIL